MEYFLVAMGGTLGGTTRYIIGKYISEKSNCNFPFGTFIINITGAILFGIFLSFQVSQSFYLFFGEGFFGAYTTFSTFMYEGFKLFQTNEKLHLLIYVLGSLALGIIGLFIGYKIGSLI